MFSSSSPTHHFTKPSMDEVFGLFAGLLAALGCHVLVQTAQDKSKVSRSKRNADRAPLMMKCLPLERDRQG